MGRFTTSTAHQRWRSSAVSESCKPIRSFGSASSPRSGADQDIGCSEAVLRNKAHLRETALGIIRRGVYPQDGGWNGWLGRYPKALVDAAFALEQRQANERQRRKSRDVGR
jgi:hypothetical protein